MRALLALLLTLLAAPALAQSPLDAAVSAAWPNLSPELARHIEQDETMRACSAARNQPTPAVAGAIEAHEPATIHLAADGVLMGDWRRGEAGAQSGYGLRMGDKNSVGRTAAIATLATN